MMPTLIVLVLLIVAVGIVILAVRRKPTDARPGPREGDTAWNDPVTSEPAGSPEGRRPQDRPLP